MSRFLFPLISLIAALLGAAPARAAAGSTEYVTPSCPFATGCMSFDPGTPSSMEQVDVHVVAYSGVPGDACFRPFMTSVVGNVISISGAYYLQNCPFLSYGQPLWVNVPLEPLAPGHYIVKFLAAADPSDGPNGWVYTGNGWVQAGVLISGTVDVSASPTGVPNYGGLWWAAPAGSESGWGINFAHQGSVIFATWFTYDVDGKGLWLSVAAFAVKPGTFSGTLARTSGPPFDAAPFDPSLVTRTPVGTASFAFSDGSHGVFRYTVNGVTQSKPITRDVLSAPGTVCQ